MNYNIIKLADELNFGLCLAIYIFKTVINSEKTTDKSMGQNYIIKLG